MTSRQYALEIPIEGKDEISKALQQAQRLVRQAAEAVNRDLDPWKGPMEEAGQAVETAGQRIRTSLGQGLESAGQGIRNAGQAISKAGQSLTTGVTVPLAAGLAFAKFNGVAVSLQAEAQFITALIRWRTRRAVSGRLGRPYRGQGVHRIGGGH